MGVFDEIPLRCPICNKVDWVQTKGGNPCMAVLDRNNLTVAQAKDAIRDDPSHICQGCGKEWVIKTDPPLPIRVKMYLGDK